MAKHHMLCNAPVLMGILNVTPDSFSDGGKFLNPERAVAQGLRLIREGADILDVGGESTRPGAEPVSAQEETDRVLPVIEGLQDCGALISIDTRHAATMKAALKAGAGMINDISALQNDPDSMAVAVKSDVLVCLMHSQGNPQTMQDNPIYNNVVSDVFAFLSQRIKDCETAGIDKNRLIADPGIGFGKALDHNLALLKNLRRLHDLDVSLLLGVSRKSFIAGICDGEIMPEQRLPGSLAAALWGLQQGVRIFRVHDVAETKQAFDVFQAAA